MAKKVSRPVLKNGSSIGPASDYIDNRILDALESFSGGGSAPDLSAYAKKIDVQNALDRKADLAALTVKADRTYVDSKVASISAGPKGDTGAIGPQGPKGATGVGIKAITIENGRFVFTMTDGTVTKLDIPA